MKKIFAIGMMITVSILAVSFIYADEGETETPATVAPAIIQVPSASSTPSEPPATTAPAQASRPAAAGKPSRIMGETNLVTADPDYMVGSVACVTASGLMQPRSRIVITDQSGSEVEFTVKTLAVIYDPSGCMMSLDRLRQGMKVQVNYKTTGENTRIATSIKVLK